MTNHDRFLELAASQIDFELSPDEQTALHRHLEGCESCRPRIARMRHDATAIAALPLLRPGWSVPALDLGRRARRSSGASLRLIAVVALSLVIAAGLIAVGAELIHRQQLLVPTVTTGPSLAPDPSAKASSPVGAWRVENVDIGDLPFGIAAVAASDSRLVAVGWRTCVPVSEPTDCWANAYTSDDGGRSWLAAPRSDALIVGFGGIGSGPEPGMLDVAAGHGAFVAIGYDELFRAATWKSIDGSVWTKSPVDATPDYQVRVRSVTSTSSGWVIGGEVFLDNEPRAAIWTSPDGVTWTRAPDGPAFDVGGYLNTGEEPGSGGIDDVIAQGPMTIAVGRTCDENGFACVPAAWTSTEGPWTRSLGVGTLGGRLRAVSLFGKDLVIAGLQCGSRACTASERLAGTMRSPDGVHWTEGGIPGTAGSFGVRALGATQDFLVGVVEAVEGVDGVDARPSPRLTLVGSIDGETWQLLDGVPELGLTDMREVGITATADGSIVIVGWGQDNSDAGFKSFVVIVTRGPG